MPRASFRRGEGLFLGIEAQRAGRAIGLAVDSHGALTLLGPAADGDLGALEAGRRRVVEAIDSAQWDQGLPLGRVDAYLFVTSSASLAEQLAALAPADGGGLVPSDERERVLAALSSADSLAALHLETELLERAGTRTRSLGSRSKSGSASPFYTSEQVIRYFTGPRTRAIRRTRLDVYIRFATNSSELDASAKKQLAELGAALQSQKLAGLDFQVGGHTDHTGPRDYNMSLSLRRANAVREYLIDRHEVSPARLTAVGFGFDVPLANGSSTEALAVNRRVDFEIDRD